MTAYLKPGYDWRHEDSQRSRALSMASEWPVAAGSKEKTSSKLDSCDSLYDSLVTAYLDPHLLAVAAGSKERTSRKLDREHNLVLEFIFLVVWK